MDTQHPPTTMHEERQDVLMWLEHESDFRQMALASLPPLDRYRVLYEYTVNMGKVLDSLPVLCDESVLDEIGRATRKLFYQLAGPEVMGFLGADERRVERLLEGSPEPDLYLLPTQ